MLRRRKKESVAPAVKREPEKESAPSGRTSAPQSTRPPSGTVLAKGVLFTGDFTSKEPMLVHGSIHGDVLSTSDIVFTGESEHKGDIRSNSLTIAGIAQGRFLCKETAELREAGKMEGTLHAARLIMSEDSVFEGNLKIEKPRIAPPQKNADEEDRDESEKEPQGTVIE